MLFRKAVLKITVEFPLFDITIALCYMKPDASSSLCRKQMLINKSWKAVPGLRQSARPSLLAWTGKT